ncbi:MAG: hypothetical protein DRR42_19080 [Gammaproteobacteria bacterium]|nr:MAG: hypothetical protein DRR42_19080 [Gammaproteobacteria bacterium]
MTEYLKIYGERNTCTRYFREIVELNLDVVVLEGGGSSFVKRLQQLLPGEELVKDVAASLSYGNDLGWKHSKLKPVEVIKSTRVLRSSEVLFVTLTKNPYSWLLSLHRRPYHQRCEKKPEFKSFLQTPWNTLRRENVGHTIRSPIELWNVKNRSYTVLHGSDLSVIKLTVEQLLLAPEAVISSISHDFQIQRLGPEFVNHDRPTKKEDTSEKGTSHYKDYYLNERWKEKLGRESIELINDSLDKSLMRYYGYEFL